MLIPNTNPALVLLSVWANPDDPDDTLVTTHPIVGWRVESGSNAAPGDVLLIDSPVCFQAPDDIWGILDRTTGRVELPMEMGFDSRDAAVKELTRRARSQWTPTASHEGDDRHADLDLLGPSDGRPGAPVTARELSAMRAELTRSAGGAEEESVVEEETRRCP
ncbi:hypothetical protein [Thiocapsa sp. UBA6158]|jgi:hypothetical protein|uniref:hypothetical protein n=1 Tax=Thiocapsa sp. UBA6158 TaxID=1947692 RepID=UPI0025FA18D9|nr:hypothetical protein [Thiocapsa sp. UBA6158]